MKICELCNKELIIKYGTNRFCNATCANKRNRSQGSVSTRICSFENCQNSCAVANGGTGRRCSEHKETHHSLKDIEILLDPRARRARLVKERGHQCEVCKLIVWMDKPIPLEADHINGDSTLNTRENLRLICPNCHAQTPTYKGKNKGNVKGARKDFYAKYPIQKYRE